VSSDGSLSICKNYHEGNPEYVLKLPNINLKIQDFFFDHVPAESDLEYKREFQYSLELLEKKVSHSFPLFLSAKLDSEQQVTPLLISLSQSAKKYQEWPS